MKMPEQNVAGRGEPKRMTRRSFYPFVLLWLEEECGKTYPNWERIERFHALRLGCGSGGLVRTATDPK